MFSFKKIHLKVSSAKMAAILSKERWVKVWHRSNGAWASYQIHKIAGCACAGNAGNVFPRRRFKRKALVSDPGMHHGTCVTHVPWCMSGSLTCGDGENVPGIPGACAPAILRIWQEAHGASIAHLLLQTYFPNLAKMKSMFKKVLLTYDARYAQCGRREDIDYIQTQYIDMTENSLLTAWMERGCVVP